MQEKKLTECEVMVMRCIWDSEEALSKQQVTELVNIRYGKSWKGQTVSTFLQRLVKKGYIQKDVSFYTRLWQTLRNARCKTCSTSWRFGMGMD